MRCFLFCFFPSSLFFSLCLFLGGGDRTGNGEMPDKSLEEQLEKDAMDKLIPGTALKISLFTKNIQADEELHIH